MSLDRSLKTSGTLASHRSVLKRHERLDKMKATANFDPSKSKVLGIPKTGNRKVGV